MGNRKCKFVSSFGSLRHFRKENKVRRAAEWKPSTVKDVFKGISRGFVKDWEVVVKKTGDS